MRRQKLVELEPRWLDIGGYRYGLGFGMRCPVCADRHRLTIPFRHPFDGLNQLLMPMGTVLHEYSLGDVTRPGQESGADVFNVLSLCPAIRHEGSLLIVDRGYVLVFPEYDG